MKGRIFYGYYVVAAGFLVWFIGWGSYSTCFGVFLKPLIAHFGWSRADASLAYSLMFLLQASAGIPMGWLTDRIGSRLLIAGFGSLLGVSYLLLSMVNTLWQFQLSYALIGGIGTSILNIPVVVTIARWFPQKQGSMLGIVQAGAGIGGFIFPSLTGWLILAYGWREAYFFMGIITLFLMVAGGWYMRSDPEGTAPCRKPVRSKEGAGHDLPAHRQPSSGLRDVLGQAPFWMLLGIFGSFGFCRATFIAHIAAHTQDLGFSLADGAFVMSLISGASIAGRVGTGRLTDRLGNRRSLALSFVLTAAAVLWVLPAQKLWMLYLFGLAFGFAWGTQAVLRYTTTTEAFGFASLGLLLGLMSFMEAVAAMLGSYMGGYIFDLFGSYEPVFWLSAALAGLGALLACLLKPAVRRSYAPSS